MRKARWLARLLVLTPIVLWLAGCGYVEKMIEDKEKDNIRDRVEAILKGVMLDNPDPAAYYEQKSACLWYRHRLFIADRDELESAVDGFDRWRIDGGFQDGVRSFEISEIEIVDGVGIVSGKINKRRIRMRVPDGDKITWMKPERRRR